MFRRRKRHRAALFLFGHQAFTGHVGVAADLFDFGQAQRDDRTRGLGPLPVARVEDLFDKRRKPGVFRLLFEVRSRPRSPAKDSIRFPDNGK